MYSRIEFETFHKLSARLYRCKGTNIFLYRNSCKPFFYHFRPHLSIPALGLETKDMHRNTCGNKQKKQPEMQVVHQIYGKPYPQPQHGHTVNLHPYGYGPVLHKIPYVRTYPLVIHQF